MSKGAKVMTANRQSARSGRGRQVVGALAVLISGALCYALSVAELESKAGKSRESLATARKNVTDADTALAAARAAEAKAKGTLAATVKDLAHAEAADAAVTEAIARLAEEGQTLAKLEAKLEPITGEYQP